MTRAEASFELDESLARAFTGALATSGSLLNPPLMLGREEFAELCRRYLPQAERILPPTPESARRTDEFGDLVALLMEYPSGPAPQTLWLAHALAAGSLGQDHLWQDMGLVSRDELSFLIRTCFGPLFALNTKNMKWKKFFYKMLCDRAEVMLCKAPSCQVCADYQACFGPED